jgi:cell wall-associated NlpC family hydrolase
LIERAEIIAAAREAVGTPYHHQGRAIGVGLDCAGVLVHVCTRLAYPVQDGAGYGKFPDPEWMRGLLDASFDRSDEMRPGDVALMRLSRTPVHLAIVGNHEYGGLSLIHAYNGVRKVVEHALDDNWTRRLVAFWRFRGVSE